MHRFAFPLLTLLTLLAPCSVTAGEQELSQTDIFVSGEGGYHSYRIPSIIRTKAGTLLAFCEGRKDSRSDAGNIDLVLRRSFDHGKTWSKMQVVWDDAGNTCGNPCPVVDQETGTIWLLLTWNAGDIHEGKIQAGFGEDSRHVYVASSSDDGATWTPPKQITRDVKDKSWSWYATGPGSGIQLQHGEHAGRMVIPCDHKIPTAKGTRFRSHVIYSDDNGATWHQGGSAPKDEVNECEVVELSDGTLLLNMRNYDRSNRSRQVCFSDDGGNTWRDQRHDDTLVSPTCQASIHRVRHAEGDKPGVILFSNPATPDKREQLTIRASYDDCQTWADSRLLNKGSSAYSSLCVIEDDLVGCLYERDNYGKITLARFPINWVKGGDQ
ncbi:sialidase family protein [Rubinisphaera margarita]|uniref:sialidase family protein n=1 Tax=Rubinisphaera margarita TaxID=2909586 RepID=UPI001EE95B04|nr:sialidase family protein [Rubinisphaera margarita]MCG6154384.1 glycoside hydrolase [Rubinisphaera margarita]